jgi:hypothetical protein
MKLHASWLAAVVSLLIAGQACNLPTFGGGTPPAVATLVQLYTAAALTVQAAGSPAVSATPTSTATNPFPTFATLGPSRTPAPVTLCDAAEFVGDITIADGSSIDPGADFTKTWRIQNVGTCSWTPAYALVFVSGDRMNAPLGLGVPGNVNPGQSIDLSVSMTAPSGNGQYQGYWKLRNPAGGLFGIGAQAQTAFWVRVIVAGPIYVAYDFAARCCDAVWQNNSDDLPCPGSQGDGKGYVVKLDHPLMENGQTADGAGLLSVPKKAYNGLITGKFPAVKIRDGDRFRALVNCAYQAYSCNVIFRLDYQIGGENTRSLGHWNEAYEGKYYPVDIDLSHLAGQYVKFILSASANGSWNQDEALWIAPRISRIGNPPPTNTPTTTPTPTLTPTLTPAPIPTVTQTPSPTPIGL